MSTQMSPHGAMAQRISMVSLGVRDVPGARAFYENGLGWRASLRSSKALAVFKAGPVLVSLVPHSELAADMGLDHDVPSRSFNGIALSYAVQSPDEAVLLLSRAEAAGGTVSRRGGETSWGGYAGSFIDPDGHAWELVWHPDWFGADGGPLID